MIMSILFIIAAAAYSIWLFKQRERGRIQLIMTVAMCDASKAFWDWRHRNQGVYIGLSPEGRNLLLRYIRIYDEWLIVHEKIDRSHYEWLVSLLNNFPPKEPNDMPPGIPENPPDAIRGIFL